MSQYKEYTRPTVGQSGCSYSMLGATYHGAKAGDAIQAMNNYMVPDYCPDGPGPNYPPRYDTLTHGIQGSCGGKFNFKNAYPFANCSSCLGKELAPYANGNKPSNIPQDALGQFSLRACNSSIVPGCEPVTVQPENKAPKKEGFFGFLGL